MFRVRLDLLAHEVNDTVWLSDFGANAVLSFHPETEEFESFDLPDEPGNVRQILRRPGEV